MTVTVTHSVPNWVNYTASEKQEAVGVLGHLLRDVTPVRTGELAGNWSVEIIPDGLLINNPTHYAGYVNNGTSKMDPRNMVESALSEFANISFHRDDLDTSFFDELDALSDDEFEQRVSLGDAVLDDLTRQLAQAVGQRLSGQGGEFQAGDRTLLTYRPSAETRPGARATRIAPLADRYGFIGGRIAQSFISPAARIDRLINEVFTSD